MPPPLLRPVCAITHVRHAAAIKARAHAERATLCVAYQGRLTAALISRRNRLASAQQCRHLKVTKPPCQLPDDLLRLIAQTTLRQEGSSQQAWARLGLVGKDWLAALQGAQH